jgi:hypothetical protein
VYILCICIQYIFVYIIYLYNVLIDYNFTIYTFNIHEYNVVLKAATLHIESNTESVYLATDKDIVIKFNDGQSDYDCVANDGSTKAIETYLEAYPYYPSDLTTLNEFNTTYSFMGNGKGLQVQYKLHGTPNNENSEYQGLYEIQDKYSQMDFDHKQPFARGVSFKIKETSKDESFEFLGFVIDSKPIVEVEDDNV